MDASLLAAIFVALVVVFLFFPVPFFSGTFFGHILGMAGALLILLALLYTYRKRVLGRKGRKNPLTTHILFGLSGPTLVVIHAGHAGSSLIGALVYLSLLTVVLSGMTGFYLFRKINRSIKEQKSELAVLNELFHKRKREISPETIRAYLGSRTEDHATQAADSEEQIDEVVMEKGEELHFIAGSIAEREYALRAFSSTKKLFSHWRNIHVYLTVFLFAILTVHILINLYYGLRWLP